MIERKEHGFMNMMKEIFSYISQIISAGIFPQIAEGTDMVIRKIERRIIHIEKRILRKISSLMIFWFG